MVKGKDGYVINLHYPDSELGLRELRYRMGKAYIKFVREYIKTLPIKNEQKNKIYFEVIKKLGRGE